VLVDANAVRIVFKRKLYVFGQITVRMRRRGSFGASLSSLLTANIDVTVAIYSERTRKEVHLAIGVGECAEQFGHFADCRRTERKHARRIPCDRGQTLRFPQARWEPREFLRLAGGGGGIRTHETLSGLTVFKTAGVNRFPTPPLPS
jgi:hypothetical protein